jgi:hypothetical protein
VLSFADFRADEGGGVWGGAWWHDAKTEEKERGMGGFGRSTAKRRGDEGWRSSGAPSTGKGPGAAEAATGRRLRTHTGVGVWSRNGSWGVCYGPGLVKSAFSELNQIFSNGLELILSKDGLLVLENFQIKHGCAGNQIRNNFPYWNFSKFRIEFELKMKEALGFKIK